MLRFALFCIAAAVFVQPAANKPATMVIKKNWGAFDPPFCFIYIRNATESAVCSGFQYDCNGFQTDKSTTNIGGQVYDFSSPSSCSSTAAFQSFADSDFTQRYAAYSKATTKGPANLLVH